jgi:hypothetical protein
MSQLYLRQAVAVRLQPPECAWLIPIGHGTRMFLTNDFVALFLLHAPRLLPCETVPHDSARP